jgi:hypothetical protein
VADLVTGDRAHLVDRGILERDIEIATRAVLPTPPRLAVKLFDWREPCT